MDLSVEAKEQIIADQSLAYSVCFSHDFINFETYTILDRPGMDFHILSSGHILERKDKGKIVEAAKNITSYFERVKKDTRISILEDNNLAKETLSEMDFLLNKQTKFLTYIFL